MVRRAFTLIELLVVVAIIALLLSILAPSLRRAKAITRSVVCRANLHQMQVAMLQYVHNYKGGIFQYNLTFDTFWVNHLRRFYSAVDNIRFCPNATVEGYCMGGYKTAWTGKNMNPNDATRWMYNGVRYINGSYGFNAWLHPGDPTYYYGDIQYIQVPSLVPVFLDCNWVDGWVSDTDGPPPDLLGSITVPNLARFAIIRHGYSINGVFFDGTARNIRLDTLFQIQWHRSFKVGATLVLPPSPVDLEE